MPTPGEWVPLAPSETRRKNDCCISTSIRTARHEMQELVASSMVLRFLERISWKRYRLPCRPATLAMHRNQSYVAGKRPADLDKHREHPRGKRGWHDVDRPIAVKTRGAMLILGGGRCLKLPPHDHGFSQLGNAGVGNRATADHLVVFRILTNPS